MRARRGSLYDETWLTRVVGGLVEDRRLECNTFGSQGASYEAYAICSRKDEDLDGMKEELQRTGLVSVRLAYASPQLHYSLHHETREPACI